MQICLLDCAAPFLIDERVFPPLGLIAVGTSLFLQREEVTIRNTPNDFRYFGMGPTTSEYPSALSLLHQIKKRNSTRVIIGGPHAEMNTEKCLADGFDTVVLGDGEKITSDVFKQSGVVNLGRGSLDTYPIPNRELLDIYSYHYEIGDKSATTLMTTRGCPYSCGFCAKSESQVRYYSVLRIEKEIDYLVTDLGYTALMIFDDTFILNKKRALRLCQILKEYGITWRCFVRGDLIIKHGKELTDTMFDSGCVQVGMGIEAASDRILKTINKGENVNTLKEAISLLHTSQIRVKGFFIVGLPGEDPSSINETQWFLEETNLDDADFTVFQPYKGSPIWDNQINYDISWGDIAPKQKHYKGKPGEYQSSVSTSSLSQNKIVEARNRLEKVFKKGE